MARRRTRSEAPHAVEKVATGIAGFDQITGGGLPRGRTSLVCGGPGCGKTLFAMEFLVRGAMTSGEPGVFIAFEETRDELAANVASLGFDVAALEARDLLAIDFIKVDRSEMQEAGEWDLDGLFVRLAYAVDSIGATRIVIDTLEALFSGFTDEALLRSELRRLFRWLKERRLTALITGERGQGALTRYGLEEYVSDCVVLLDNRVIDQAATRRLQIVKYRGSAHGADEYPFLIDADGISVLPISSIGLDYPVSDERVPTGVPALDGMLDGGGYFRGSSVMVSGSAGTGKSSLAGLFAEACCRRKERTLYFALEESAAQISRNLRSIGVDLAACQKKKLLEIRAQRPTVYGLEMHLVAIHKAIEAFQPRAIVIDPISSLVTAGNAHEVKSMLVRLLDYLKVRQITLLVTALTSAEVLEESTVGISSLIDTWLQLRDIETGGERTRGLYLIKSRGMGHSNQVREFVITSQGVDLVPVAVGPAGVLTGSARIAAEAAQRVSAGLRTEDHRRRERTLARKQRAVTAQIEALRAEMAAAEEELHADLAEALASERRTLEAQARSSQLRSAPRAVPEAR